MNNKERRAIRLKYYDYSQAGAYFVTLCTHDRECLFGSIENSEMALNEYGRIVDFTWNDLVNHNSYIGLGGYVIMPNHFHGIIVINPVGAGSKPAPNLVGTSARAGLEPAPTQAQISNYQFIATMCCILLTKADNTHISQLKVWRGVWVRHQDAGWPPCSFSKG